MAHLTKHGKSWWYSEYQGKGRPRIQLNLGPDEKTAKQFLAAQEEARLRTGGDKKLLASAYEGMAAALRSMDVSLASIVKDYEDAKRGEIKDSSLDSYMRYLNAFVEAFASVDFRTLTRGRVTKWIREQPTAHNSYAKALKALGTYCDIEGLWPNNALKRLAVKPSKARTETVPWSRVIELVGELEGTQLHGPFLAAAFAGLRASEVCHVRLENIDREAGTLAVRAIDVREAAKTREGVKTNERIVWSPKNDHERSVPLHPTLLAAIREGDRGWVFLDKFGRQWNRHYLYARMKRATGYDLHILRHTLLSRLINRGAGASVARDIAGHTSIGVTDGYAHAVPEDLRRAIHKL